ncbi:MAG: hypothetical protein M3O15_07995 [Acidobacteriota bacterium]|nr:hypothetical protein [Acidobacteriota bacterium]
MHTRPSLRLAVPSAALLAVFAATAGDVAQAAPFPVAEPAASPFVLDSTPAINFEPIVASDARGNSVIAWSVLDNEGGRVVAMLVDSRGQAHGPLLQVSTITGISQLGPLVAMNEQGRFVVAWSSVIPNTQTNDLRAQIFGRDGTKIGPEIAVNLSQADGSPATPAVAIDSEGNVVLAWAAASVLVRRFDRRGAPLGPETVLTAPGQANYPQIVKQPDGGFAVLWFPNYLPKRNLIYGRRFRPGGKPEAANFSLNLRSTLPLGEEVAAATTAEGDFILTWQVCNMDAVDPRCEVHARRFDANGRPLSAEFRVSPENGRSHNSPGVVVGAHGYFMIVWYDCERFGVDCRPAARAYNAEDAPALNESALATGDDTNSLSATAGPNGFQLVWNTNTCFSLAPDCQNDTPQGIYTWRFDFPHRHR